MNVIGKLKNMLKNLMIVKKKIVANPSARSLLEIWVRRMRKITSAFILIHFIKIKSPFTLAMQNKWG